MKTSNLNGAALDWAVGTALKLPPPLGAFGKCAQFSTDWAQGGPIIEQESIQICQLEDGNWRGQLHAKSFGPYCRQYDTDDQDGDWNEVYDTDFKTEDERDAAIAALQLQYPGADIDSY